ALLRLCHGILLLSGLLLAGNRPARTLLGTGVRVRALTTNGEATTVTQTTITADIHQPLDVPRHLRPQHALDPVGRIDRPTEAIDLLVGELVHPPIRIDTRLVQNPLGRRASDSVDVRQSDRDALLTRQIDTRDASHVLSPMLT